MSEWDDLYRFCVFCKADCYVDEPEHAADCPSSTGVYPVEHLRLPDEDKIDAVCSECEAPFDPGDSYVSRRIEDNIYEPICIGCAALESV